MIGHMKTPGHLNAQTVPKKLKIRGFRLVNIELVAAPSHTRYINILMIAECSTIKYPSHIFKSVSDQTSITGSVDDGVSVLVTCRDPLLEESGTELICSGETFRSVDERDLFEALPCSLGGSNCFLGPFLLYLRWAVIDK